MIADYRNEEVDEVIMRDVDGSGSSITIPGYMVNYEHAKLIEKIIEDGVENQHFSFHLSKLFI